MKKIVLILMILILIPVAVLTMRAFSMNNSGWSYWIKQEYLGAMKEFQQKAEKALVAVGDDFSLEDKTILTDLPRLQSAVNVVEETVRIDNQMFDDMMGKIDQLKTKYAESAPISPELQESYDGLRKDFEDLKKLETSRGYYMTALLDFVIANQGNLALSGKKVVIEQEELSKKYNALEKAVQDSEKNFLDKQNRLLDRHFEHLNVFTGELGKLQKLEYDK